MPACGTVEAAARGLQKTLRAEDPCGPPEPAEILVETPDRHGIAGRHRFVEPGVVRRAPAILRVEHLQRFLVGVSGGVHQRVDAQIVLAQHRIPAVEMVIVEAVGSGKHHRAGAVAAALGVQHPAQLLQPVGAAVLAQVLLSQTELHVLHVAHRAADRGPVVQRGLPGGVRIGTYGVSRADQDRHAVAGGVVAGLPVADAEHGIAQRVVELGDRRGRAVRRRQRVVGPALTACRAARAPGSSWPAMSSMSRKWM